MTNNNSEDRLDRIEGLLEVTVQGLAETRRLTESNSRAIESNTRNIAETRAAIAETKKIVDSNSRTIQAMLEARASEQLRHEERMRRLEETINNQLTLQQRLTRLQEGLGNMLAKIDDDRPTILRKLTTIENKIDRIIESK